MRKDGSFGLSVALATPFDRSNNVDLASYATHAQRCLATGCDSITALGTTGEAANIGMHTRTRMLATLTRAGISGDQLIVGICATSVEDAVSQITLAQGQGASRVLVPPPFYFSQCSEHGIGDWYEAVFSRLGNHQLPMILYNIPSMTGVSLSLDLITRLRDQFGSCIAGVKDSSGDWDYTAALLKKHSDIPILVGDERHLGAAMRAGAQGAISGVANIHPDSIRTMIDNKADDQFVNELVNLCSNYSIVPAIKTIMTFAYSEPQWSTVHAPLEALSGAEKDQLIQGYVPLTAEPA